MARDERPCTHPGAKGPCVASLASNGLRCIWCERPMTAVEPEAPAPGQVRVTLTVDAEIWQTVREIAQLEHATESATAEWLLELAQLMRDGLSPDLELHAFAVNSAARGAPWPCYRLDPIASDPAASRRHIIEQRNLSLGIDPNGPDWS